MANVLRNAELIAINRKRFVVDSPIQLRYGVINAQLSRVTMCILMRWINRRHYARIAITHPFEQQPAHFRDDEVEVRTGARGHEPTAEITGQEHGQFIKCCSGLGVWCMREPKAYLAIVISCVEINADSQRGEQ